jgi:HSP20 family molecular chaperone IbpA
MMESGSMETTLMGLDEPEEDAVNWQGAVIAVVGLYDKGKTFVLNQITQANLPSGKKCTTKGLSFKHVNVEQTNFVLLDSAGSYSPVKVVDELSVAQKEATELFLLDLIFDLSDYFICVVNDFTSLDQRYLDKLTRSLQNSSKTFREVIVVHNLKEVTSAQVLAHVWAMQVTQIYTGGQRMSTQVGAINPQTGKLEERQVEWFKTRYTRHICLAHHDSPVGRDVNPWTFSLLRYWLKSVFVPVDRRFSVVNAVIHHSNKKLSSYFKDAVHLTLQSGKEDRVKFIRPSQSGNVKSEFRLPQVALDASGLMLTRPDSFIPPVDILEEGGYYTIYMDVPGLSAKDITLARQNVITIIKGSRSVPYQESQAKIEKQERKYGDFTSTFTIPQKFERRWDSCTVDNGVLMIRFKGDLDDDEESLLKAAMPELHAAAADGSLFKPGGGE